MRFGLFVLLIMIGGMVTQWYLPWWSLVLVAFLAGYFLPLRRTAHSFFAGFVAGFLLWSLYASYLEVTNDGVLAARIGFLLGGISGSLLPLLSGIFAGILSGMGALSGKLGKEAVRR